MRQISWTSHEIRVKLKAVVDKRCDFWDSPLNDFIWTSTATLSIKNQLDQLYAHAHYLSAAPHKDV